MTQSLITNPTSQEGQTLEISNSYGALIGGGFFLIIASIACAVLFHSDLGHASFGCLGGVVLGGLIIRWSYKRLLSQTSASTFPKSPIIPSSDPPDTPRQVSSLTTTTSPSPGLATGSSSSSSLTLPFSIPDTVKKIISKNIEMIKRGESNDIIRMHSCSHNNYVFTVQDYPFFFKLAKESSKRVAEKRLLEKNKARGIVQEHGLKDTIVIPQAEIFTFGDDHFIGVEALNFEPLDQQLHFYETATSEQICHLAEFIILSAYSDMKYWNVQKLSGQNRFGVIDFDDSRYRDSDPRIERIFTGLFGMGNQGILEGLFGTAAVNGTDTRFRVVLEAILDAARKHKILDSLEEELEKRSFFLDQSAVWLKRNIADIKRSWEQSSSSSSSES